jgi:hypothetical protein
LSDTSENWRRTSRSCIMFTLVLIKINYGQIGDQTGLFYTTNPVFYTSGNIFVRRTGMFGNLWFFHWSRRTTIIQDLLVRRYRQCSFYKNICYHYTKEIDLIVPSLFVTTARPQCALWPRAANSFLARYAGGLYKFPFEADLSIVLAWLGIYVLFTCPVGQP